MTRLAFIKDQWWRILPLLALTLYLPYFEGAENPMVVSPYSIFSFLAFVGWLGFLGMLLLPDEARGEFDGSSH
ncbi:hypothetical protein [Neptuniibacter sp. QD37_11]|uniref:hypothetical protein n=1 Tax=Neptuniibacter sp. QD37_11 TaxID=3398209 RepID=UPI0039F4D457